MFHIFFQLHDDCWPRAESKVETGSEREYHESCESFGHLAFAIRAVRYVFRDKIKQSTNERNTWAAHKREKYRKSID